MISGTALPPPHYCGTLDILPEKGVHKWCWRAQGISSPFPPLEERGPPQRCREKVITKARGDRGPGLGHDATTAGVMVTQQSCLLMAPVSSAAPAVRQRHPSPTEQEPSLRLGHTGIHVRGWYGTTPSRKKKRTDILYACPRREPISARQTRNQTQDPTERSPHGWHCRPWSSCYCSLSSASSSFPLRLVFPHRGILLFPCCVSHWS